MTYNEITEVVNEKLRENTRILKIMVKYIVAKK